MRSHAQDTSNTIGHVSIASPTAASLGKYGDYPVSYNTGLPQIGIPIYTAEAGSLKLPVSLSYHASGLKVQENASWVGAGWSLNAGGAITRTVVGGPDDRGLGSYNVCQYGYYSDYGYDSYEFITGSGIGIINGVTSDDHSFETGVKDGQPDLFFFNFGGYTGKFYFNDDRTPILVPQQDFKIVPDLLNGGNTLGFQGFIVTTPDGVKYFFGKTGNNDTVDPVEVTIAATLQNGPVDANAAVSSWFLNKIVSADGMDSITLTYQKEQYSYYTLVTSPIDNVKAFGILQPVNIGYNVIKNFVQGVRLAGISFPNGDITFTKAASPRTDLSDYGSQAFSDIANTGTDASYALGSIRISDNKGFCKFDSLYYGYFYDANAYTLNGSTYDGFNIQSDQYRLRLDSIQEQSCDGSLKIPPYKFAYFPELVPRKLSFGMDHWGFSNGVTNNSTLVPTYTWLNGNDMEIKAGGYRDAAFPAMRGGALQQITYPTGGSTRFGFEANDTYVQYTTYTNTQILSNALGSAIGQNAGSVNFSFTASNGSNIYRLVLESDNQTGSGNNWELKDATGTIILNEHVDVGTSSHPDSTKTFYFTLTTGATYHGTFFNNSTGGSTSFNLYEQNGTSVTGNAIVGGLRIKADTISDAITSNDHIRTYTYTNGGSSSSGILYSRPVYVQTIRNDIYGLVYTDLAVNGCGAPNFLYPQGLGGNYYLSGGSVTPMATVQGNHIGYNQVQVTEAGNGYSIYRYYGSNVWDSLYSDVCTRVINIATCPLTIPNYPAAPEPFEPLRGELKYEGHFNQSGHALKDATYTYSYKMDSLVTPGIIFNISTSFAAYTPYLLQSAKKVQTQVVSTLYDPSGSNAVTTTSTTYFGSRYHNQATRKVTTTSTGDSLVSTILYAFDFRVPACDAIPDSLPFYMNTVHADSVQLFTHDTLCPPSSTDWTCRYDTFQVFRRNMNLARIQYINYRRRSFADSGNLLSACYVDSLGTADALLKPVLRLQKEYNNAAIEAADYKDQYLKHANFTQYDTSQNPIGFAYPGRTQLVNLRGVSGALTDAMVSGNTITRDSRYQDESFYQFARGNPQQVTPFSGIPTSYIWDYLNTHPIAKVTNASANQVAYTSFEADDTGNWTVGSSTRDTTTGITGTKSYHLSSDISKSALNSSTTYLVSYWTQNTGAFSISGTITGYPVRGKTVSINNHSWTLWVHKVTGQTTISLSGSGPIDELRLYPATAQMTTYTYSPLVGMTSQCDAGNRITYYEYDGLARLKRVRDQDYNILKSLEYQYQASSGCGGNCYSIAMQTFAGTNTLGYPVGVFGVQGNLLGNATNAAGYISLWNADSADAHIGTLAAGKDSLHFNITLNSGQTMPAGVTGCRYYQVDLAWNFFDGAESTNAVYVDFGDSIGIHMAKTILDTPAVIPANTNFLHLLNQFNNQIYIQHTYPDTSVKTLTFYHNDGIEHCILDNGISPATSLTKLTNLRGNLPQNTATFGATGTQQASMLTETGISNWNSIHTIQSFTLRTGDRINQIRNANYTQDFMKNNTGLLSIDLTAERDSIVSFSTLKSDWSSYFTHLQSLTGFAYAFAGGDLTGLKDLKSVTVLGFSMAPQALLDSIINQVAAGSGQTISNGLFNFAYAGANYDSSSFASFQYLLSKGWIIFFNNVQQHL